MAKPRGACAGLGGKQGSPAGARRRAWLVARETCIDERLSHRQGRLFWPVCQSRRGGEDKGRRAPPPIQARFKRAEEYFLASKPLGEPVPRADVEFGVSRGRTGRIDARDFEPVPVLEDQFEPLIDRGDPAACATFVWAKPIRRLHSARAHKRNDAGGEKNGKAQARPGAKADWQAHWAIPKRAPSPLPLSQTCVDL